MSEEIIDIIFDGIDLLIRMACFCSAFMFAFTDKMDKAIFMLLIVMLFEIRDIGKRHHPSSEGDTKAGRK